MKAEETEGAKEGLGVGDKCSFCDERAVASTDVPNAIRYCETHMRSEQLRPPQTVPDQVLTPLSALDGLWWDYDYDVASQSDDAAMHPATDGDIAQGRTRIIEAVEAAIRQQVEAMYASLVNEVRLSVHGDPAHRYGTGQNDDWCVECQMLTVIQRSSAAALAGVPKEAGEAECKCGAPRRGWCLDATHGGQSVRWAAHTDEAFRPCAHTHEFEPGVVAAPVEDANA